MQPHQLPSGCARRIRWNLVTAGIQVLAWRARLEGDALDVDRPTTLQNANGRPVRGAWARKSNT